MTLFSIIPYLVEENGKMGANLRHYLLSDLQGNLFMNLILYLGPINQEGQVFHLVRN